jgi:hypothetical protein
VVSIGNGLAGPIKILMSTSGVCVLMITLSCSHSSKLLTNPAGASVTSMKEDGSRGASLGMSPIEIQSTASSSEVLEINKSGYVPAIVVVPEIMLSERSNSELQINLRPTSESWFETELLEGQPQILDGALYQIFNLQSLILNGKFAEANAFVKRVETKYRMVSFFYLLKGHLAMQTKDTKSAKESFRKAAELNPKSKEARSLLETLN